LPPAFCSMRFKKRSRSHSPMRSLHGFSERFAEEAGRRDTRQQLAKENITWQQD
jgi:hypothetical protein